MNKGKAIVEIIRAIVNKIKPNQKNRPCNCKKWSTDKSDRKCQGHVPGVGHGEYFRNPTTGEWWSKDLTGHSSNFKVFKQQGDSLVWVKDTDQFGDFIDGKHKSDVGKKINMKDLKCQDIKPN